MGPYQVASGSFSKMGRNRKGLNYFLNKIKARNVLELCRRGKRVLSHKT
jgi:hypothetical protein